MFFDEAKIFLQSGAGGDGMISFRREKYVPYGGPDGGDGGRGGHIILQVNPKLNSLAYFHRRVHFRAKPGVHGGRKNQTGAMGEDLVLQIPPGTLVRDFNTGELLADLTEPEQKFIVVQGGEGGRGNARFASSAQQAPKVAERGESSVELWITLELKLIADVGLVGKPNAGKSTLLAAVSAARPKVANYPFTTLKPNLGVVALGDYESFVMADIPGLIEGAADGVGLGHDFLRHVERTRLLVHVLDGAAAEPLEDWKAINAELQSYSPKLAKKPQLVVLNKIDLPNAIAWDPLIEEEIVAQGFEYMSISGVTGHQVQELLWQIKQKLEELPEPEPFVEDESLGTMIQPEADPDHFEIEQLSPTEWRVHGKRIEKVASVTYFEFPETAERFQRILDSIGISQALEEAGVKDNDIVHIGTEELEWQLEDD